MEQALLDSAIEFCELVGVAITTIEPVRLRAGQAEYEVDVPTGTTTSTLLNAWYGDTPLTLVGPEWFTKPTALNDVVGETEAATGTPQFVGLMAPDVARLYPVPDTTEPRMLTLRVATKPTRTATEVEDVLFENWVETIVAGAARRLHGVDGQPYTSPTRELSAMGAFNQGVSRARIEAIKGRVRSSAAVKTRAFA
jgi:hypothetical protein